MTDYQALIKSWAFEYKVRVAASEERLMEAIIMKIVSQGDCGEDFWHDEGDDHREDVVAFEGLLIQKELQFLGCDIVCWSFSAW